MHTSSVVCWYEWRRFEEEDVACSVGGASFSHAPSFNPNATHRPTHTVGYICSRLRVVCGIGDLADVPCAGVAVRYGQLFFKLSCDIYPDGDGKSGQDEYAVRIPGRPVDWVV